MEWYNVLITIIMFVFGGLSYYYNTKSKLSGKVDELITEAEKKYSDIEKSGDQKLNYVVSILYSYIPIQFKWMFPEEALKLIIEASLNEMKRFTKTQIIKIDEKAEKAMDDLIDKVK